MSNENDSASWKKPGEKFIEVFKDGDFSKWLEKNHGKEKKIGLILQKKHINKNSPSHHDLMLEAICHGWIDTTLRRIDENRFVRFFARRSDNSRWSYNTLRYGEKLAEEGKMKPHGLKFFEEGKKKKPHDFGIPVNPDMPVELKKALEKNKKARDNFESFSPSVKRTYYRWILRAKLAETKKKRVDSTVRRSLEKIKPGTLSAINE